jgi:hypothetical protein
MEVIMHDKKIKFLSIVALCVLNFSLHGMNLACKQATINNNSSTKVSSFTKSNLLKNSSRPCKDFFTFTKNKKNNDGPFLKIKEFHDLAKYSREFLQKNGHRLALQENETGFVRISLPPPPSFSNKIEKIRLNYWAPDSGIEIQPESIHNHPRYFESFIINGGYNHALYEFTSETDNQPYSQFRIFRKNNGQEKNFMFIGPSQLKFIKQEFFANGAQIPFKKSMIHRVLSTYPATLTLNVVLKGDAAENSYDVFISPDGSFNDVKIERKILLNEESKQFTHEIIEHLKKF